MEVETLHFDLRNNTKICQSVNEKSKLTKLDECINSIIKKEGYITCDVVKKKLAADGGNFLGVLFEIDVRGKTDDGDKETAIFVKSIDSDCDVLEVVSVPNAYKNELFLYKDLTQVFKELQDEANIPVEERYNTVKCYEESYEKAIIMENITRKGYKVSGYRMEVICLKVAEECIKQLAKLHGLSYVLEQKRPKYFTEKIKQKKTSYIFGEAWNKFCAKFLKLGLEHLDEELGAKVEKKIPAILKNVEKYHTDEATQYCLCHGDYRLNNIMTKEINGSVMVIPVDYQLIFFGCPMLDFLYFMYLSTDRQFRDTNMVYLKDVYYKSLEDFLRYFDMSAESVFPRTVFENMYHEKLDFGLAMTFLISPFLFVSENAEVPDVTKDSMENIDFKLDDKFKDRIRDAVEEFIDLGYL